MRALFVIALITTIGCGEDPDETCKPEGFSDGESIVAGAPLGPFVRAALITPNPRPAGGVAFALALDEGDGECGEPGPGRRISVLFCGTPEPKTYEIVVATAFRCPTENVMALLEDENGTDIVGAIDGTVTVSYAGGCVAGSYELQLGNDQMSGTFDAVVCPSE